MDALGLARGRSHAIPPWLNQEVHEAKDRGANEALAIHCLASVAPMFVEVTVVLVKPRRQYHNFQICPDGATWMASTVFCEACLAMAFM